MFTVADTTGAVHTSSTLDVDGAANFDGAIVGATTLAITGVSTLTGLVTGAAGFSTPVDFTTTGTGSLVSANDLTVADDATITGDLNVIGTLTTGTVNYTNLSATGDIDFADAGADTLLLGAAADTVTVLGDVSITDTQWAVTAAGAATVASLTNNGTLAVAGTSNFTADVTLTGVGTDLAVGGDSTLTGTLAVTSTTTLTGAQTLVGNTDLRGVLADSTGNLTVTDSVDLTGTLAVTGAMTVSTTLDVTGITTIAANLNANGGFDVDDSFVILDGGATTVGSTLAVTGIQTNAANLNADGGFDVDDSFVVANGGAVTVGGAFDSNGDVSIADTNIVLDGATTTFTSTGDITLDSGGGQLILANADTINTGGVTGVAYNSFADDNGAAADDAPEIASINSDNDLYIGDSLEVDGISSFGAGVTFDGATTYNAPATYNSSPTFTTALTLSSSLIANGGITTSSGTALNINTTAGATDAINIGTNTSDQSINIATGTAVKTLNLATGIGIVTGGNTVNVGTGDNIFAQTINVATGAAGANSTVNVLSGVATAGTQTLNLGTGASAKTVNIGNATGATNLVLNAGTAGFDLAATSVIVDAYDIAAASLTTGDMFDVDAAALTTGDVFDITYTGTSGAAIRVTDSTAADANDMVFLNNSAADVTGQTYLLRGQYADTGDAEADFLLFEDAGGTDQFVIGQDGDVTVTGAAEGTAALTLTAGDVRLTDGDVVITAGDFDMAGFDVTVTTGATVIAGAADGTDALTLTLGDILLSNGDLDLSGGDFNVVLDIGDTGSFTSNAAATSDSLLITNTGVGSDGQTIAFTQNDDADATDATAGLRLSGTSNVSGDADTFRAIDIDNITAGAATESAIVIGTGWDNIFDTGGFDVVNATGATTITGAAEGTAALTLTAGDVRLTDGDVVITAGDFDMAGFDVTVTTGATVIAGAADGTDALTLTLGDILLSNGDLDLSGGDFNVTLDIGDTGSFTSNAAATSDSLLITNSGIGSDGQTIAFTQTDDADATDATAGLRLSGTSNLSGDADTFRAIDIDNITAGAAAETAIVIGTGWDNIFDTGGFDVVNATGATTITGAAEGTAALTLTAGDVRLTDGDVVITAGDFDMAGFDVTVTTGATVIAGAAEGTAALTLTAGDVRLTDGDVVITAGDFDMAGFDVTVTTGATVIAGAGDGTDALTLTLGDILLSNGDLDLSGGDFNVVLDAGDTGSFTSNADATADGLSVVMTTDTNAIDAMTIDVTSQDDNGDVTETIRGLVLTGTQNSDDATNDDHLFGLDITNMAGIAASGDEVALRIGSAWDSQIRFNDTSTFIDLANSGSITFEDDAAADGNNILVLTDVSEAANHVLSGDADTGLVLSGMTTDISTATNEALTITAGGTGDVIISTDSDTDFDVDGTGNIEIDASSLTTGTERLCSDETNQDKGIITDARIGDCAAAGQADYAENYPVASNVEYGDIVAPGSQEVVTEDGDVIVQLVKTSTSYQGNLSGIVRPDMNDDVTVIGYNIAESDNPMPVALVGRVPVNVTDENGAIAVGDFVTTSSSAGKGMKATEAGRVIGMALSSFDGDDGQVMVQVINTWYQPSSSESSDIQGSSSSSLDAGAVSATSLVVDGDSVFNGSVVVAEHLVGSGDMAGRARITSGETSVHVEFEEEYAYQPIVTATQRTARDIPGYWWIEEESSTGFDLVLDGTLGYDVEFNWIALGVDGGKVSVSDGSIQNIELYVVDGGSGAEEVSVSSDSSSSSPQASSASSEEEAVAEEVAAEEVVTEEAATEEVAAEEVVAEEAVVEEAATEEVAAEEPVAEVAVE